MPPSAQENVKWIDGLRGMASVLVVLTHIARALDPDLFSSTSHEHQPPRLLQLPFIRVFVQGRIGVSIFSLVTGYVCALKPIRQIARGQHEAAALGIAKSAFRRVPRLVLPVTIATVGIYVLCQLGAFRVAKVTDSPWLSYSSPEYKEHFVESVRYLLFNIIETWVYCRNAFDPNHWNLQPLLKGSMLVYISLLASMYARPKYRMMMSLGQWVYYWIANDSPFGMQFFFGLFLADLQNHAPAIEWTNARSWTKYYLAPLLMVLGLYFASYPEEHQEWMPWSHSLHLFSQYLLPEDYDHPRFFTGLGLECITLAIHFSPMLKDLLANRYFLWLGKQSFAVYLIHGTLLRTLLTWMVYGVRTPRPVQNEDGVWQAGEVLKVKSWPMLVVHIPLFFVILYSLAMIWVKYVDSACARWTESLVKYVQREDQNEKLPVVGRKEDGERLPR